MQGQARDIRCLKQGGISILEFCFPICSNRKFQIRFTIGFSFGRKLGSIVHHVLKHYHRNQGPRWRHCRPSYGNSIAAKEEVGVWVFVSEKLEISSGVVCDGIRISILQNEFGYTHPDLPISSQFSEKWMVRA